jgi:G:T-mismatch repair DNA endonuclease (very short patch repair protein)
MLHCSRKCALADKQANLPAGESSFVEGPCVVCGIPVRRNLWQVAHSKAAGLLCSRACHYKARSLGLVKRVVTKPYHVSEAGKAALRASILRTVAKRNAEGRYGHTEATKRRLSEAQALNMASGKVSRISKLETAVGACLTRRGIKVVPQFLVRGEGGRYIACCDFYLPDLKLAVEVNGTYWHADPRVYPNGPDTPSQKRTCEKYAVKRAALKVLGIKVREVWEEDFKKDPEGSVSAALG